MARNQLWIRLAQDFDEHEKIAGLSSEAFRTLVEMILYSARRLTDGFIPERVAIRRWGITDSVTHSVTDPLTELLTNDATHPSLIRTEVDGVAGFLIHDYLEHQESRADIENRRDRNRQNGKKGGRPVKNTRKITQSVTESVSQSLTDSGTQTEPRIKNQELKNSIDDDSQVSLLSNYRARKEIDLGDHTKQALSELGVEAAAWAVAAAQLNLRDERGLVEVASWLLGKTIEVKQNPTGYLIGCLRASLHEVQAYVTDMDLVA